MLVNRKPSSVSQCPDGGFDVVANSGHVAGPFRTLDKGDDSPDNSTDGKVPNKLSGFSSYDKDAEGKKVSNDRDGDPDPENDWYYQDPTMEGYKPAGIKRDSNKMVSPDGKNLTGKRGSSGQRNSFKNANGEIPQKIQMNSKGFKMGEEDPNANMRESGLTGTGSTLNSGVAGLKAPKGKGAIINLKNNGIERTDTEANSKKKIPGGSKVIEGENDW